MDLTDYNTKMELKELVIRNRSCRRFSQTERLTTAMVAEWMDMARRTASARNMQSLKYVISCQQDTNEALFSQLKWAGYLPDWNPSREEQPSAYVIFCNDKNLSATTPQIDLGIQAQTLLLAATESGYGGCILLAFDKVEISKILKLPKDIDPVLVVALGRPNERCVITSVENGDIKYYRDENGTHFVPKRSLEELIISAE